MTLPKSATVLLRSTSPITIQRHTSSSAGSSFMGFQPLTPAMLPSGTALPAISS
jgi:hypothetical protein